MEVQVFANKSINATGIRVVKKDVYIFNVSGLWKDLTIESDANGWNGKTVFPLAPWIYDNSFLDSQKVFPGANYMKLIGKVGEISFEIGNAKNISITMPESGELMLYANDIPLLYFNNSGSIMVKIEKKITTPTNNTVKPNILTPDDPRYVENKLDPNS